MEGRWDLVSLKMDQELFIHNLMFCHWGSAIFIIHDCISLGGGHSKDRMDVQRTED